MKRFVISIMVCLVILAPTTSKANVVVLKQGERAPFEGFLMGRDTEKAVRVRLIEADAMKLVNESLEKSLSLQMDSLNKEQQKLGICQEQNDKLAKSLYSERSHSDLERIVWFSLGILAAIGAVYGAKQIQ